jgi:hypothetical protein
LIYIDFREDDSAIIAAKTTPIIDIAAAIIAEDAAAGRARNQSIMTPA